MKYRFVMNAPTAKMAVTTLLLTRDSFTVTPALDGRSYEIVSDANPYLLKLDWFSRSFTAATQS